MKCPACRGKMEQGTTTLPYELGRGKLIVVQDVPALVCIQCGEVFIESVTLKKVETLLNTVEKSGMTMGFLEYRAAA
ncbi:MAG: YgiT-type zinc finger domain-containing protein [Deltaproteobacteria bacterium RIFOXYD12_FULL_50_9]|nr:MAG: YgiT-type zinc finger domain-containing protein [Deltaproteobacteria bacterium RIFOXYD12_FULL_50_9]